MAGPKEKKEKKRRKGGREEVRKDRKKKEKPFHRDYHYGESIYSGYYVLS